MAFLIRSGGNGYRDDAVAESLTPGPHKSLTKASQKVYTLVRGRLQSGEAGLVHGGCFRH